MNFPLARSDGAAIPWNVCPSCANKIEGEPNSFALLSGGALLMNKAHTAGGRYDRMEAFLDITWHGAHGELSFR